MSLVISCLLPGVPFDRASLGLLGEAERLARQLGALHTVVVNAVNTEIVKVVRMVDVAEKIDGMGFVPVGNSADAFGTAIRSEFEKWETAIRENQIRLD